MPDLPTAIASLRAASAAVMKITPTGQADANGAPQFNVSMVGSAWCVARGRCRAEQLFELVRPGERLELPPPHFGQHP